MSPSVRVAFRARRRGGAPRWPRPSASGGGSLKQRTHHEPTTIAEPTAIACQVCPELAYCLTAASDLPDPKPVEWIGSARNDLREMPEEVQDNFGFALYQAQLGLHHATARRLRGEFGGLIELVDDFDGDTYRAVYTVKLAGVVYVLHVFQKKSKRGIATPRQELAVIRHRWKEAKWHYATHYQQDHEREED